MFTQKCIVPIYGLNKTTSVRAMSESEQIWQQKGLKIWNQLCDTGISNLEITITIWMCRKLSENQEQSSYFNSEPLKIQCTVP